MESKENEENAHHNINYHITDDIDDDEEEMLDEEDKLEANREMLKEFKERLCNDNKSDWIY